MSPEPDPNATMATPSESTKPMANATRVARGRPDAERAGAGIVIGCFVSGVTSAIVGAVCGFTAAVLATTSVIAGDAIEAEPVAIAALAGPSIAGRWRGAPYAIKNDVSRCGADGECKLVIDIVPCANGWCGVEVDQANSCAGEALQLKPHADRQRINAFEGKLSLGPDTQSYVIEAQLESAEEGRPARLEIVGDTGPEFRMFRRSFPFHAALTRNGDAVCKGSDKPLS